MRASSILLVVARILLSGSPVLLIWRPVVVLTFGFAQGQYNNYQLGDGYEIWLPEPKLMRWPSEAEFVHIIPERILEFAVTEEWVIGRTKQGWFAVNKKTHDINYPCPSESEVRSLTDLNASLSPATWEHLWPYAMPWTKKAVAVANRICWVLVFAVPALVGFGPPLLRMVSKKGGKLSEGGDADAARV